MKSSCFGRWFIGLAKGGLFRREEKGKLGLYRFFVKVWVGLRGGRYCLHLFNLKDSWVGFPHLMNLQRSKLLVPNLLFVFFAT